MLPSALKCIATLGLLAVMLLGSQMSVLPDRPNLKTDHFDVTERDSVNIAVVPACHRDSRILRILQQAGYAKPSAEQCAMLPSWNDVERHFGYKSVVLGMQHCSAFRALAQQNNVTEKLVVAGLFDSGTNALRLSLGENLAFPGSENDTDVRLAYGGHGDIPNQRPDRVGHMAKHVVPHALEPHLFQQQLDTGILNVVIVRDPFMWMKSICKAHYKVTNLVCRRHVPRLIGKHGIANAIQVDDETYTSVIDLWNQFYEEYFDLQQEIPLLIVRFEDLLFRQEDLLAKVGGCIGVAPKKIHLRGAPAKDHGKSSGLIEAIAQYSNNAMPLHKFMPTPDDMSYVKDVVNPNLLDVLHYEQVPEPAQIMFGL